MTNEYELADNTRAKLIFEREDLLAPLLAGMEKPPHAMAPGKTEQDYYEGTVLGSAPTSTTKDTDSK
jgi:formate hydrogenlyase subunit 6/NADH:ubiquinone oxidoreductase subunit I